MGNRCTQCRRYGTAHEDATQVVSHTFEAIDLLLLTAIDLDDLLVGDGFLHGRGHEHHVVVFGMHESAQTLAEFTHGNPQHRNHHQRDEHELPVQVKQPGQQTNDGDTILDQRGQHGGTGRGDAVDIIGDAVDGFGRRVFLEEIAGQTHQMREHFGADLKNDFVLYPGNDVGCTKTEHTAQQKNTHHAEGQPEQRRISAEFEAIIKHGLEQRRQ